MRHREAFSISIITALLIILALLTVGRAAERESAVQSPSSKYLVLSTVLEDKEVSRDIANLTRSGAKVVPQIGRLFIDANVYQHVLILYIRDDGFQHRIMYYKTRQGQIPVVMIALPGKIIDVKMAELMK
jgi:hypothetical protein